MLLPHADTAELSLNASQFEVLRLFPTPVLVAPLNDAAALNAALRDTILSHRASSQGVTRSNAGGWQSTDDFATWCGPAGKRLLAVARQLADQFTAVQTDTELLRQPPAWKVNAWANVNAPGDHNHAHHHPAAFWSAVYWVEAGEDPASDPPGGEFEMSDPRGILPGFIAPTLRYALPGCLSAGSSDYLTPKSGTLILFPSWLVHAVRRYHGRAERISVAFNFSP